MVRFSWVLFTSCGLLLGRPSSSPRLLGGGGGGPLPPVPGFPGSPGLPGFPGFPGFDGDPDLEGVLGSGALPFVSVSVVWVVVPLMAGFLSKSSIFFAIGRGVFGGVLPVINRPGYL